MEGVRPAEVFAEIVGTTGAVSTFGGVEMKRRIRGLNLTPNAAVHPGAGVYQYDLAGHSERPGSTIPRVHVQVTSGNTATLGAMYFTIDLQAAAPHLIVSAFDAAGVPTDQHFQIHVTDLGTAWI